MEAKDLKVGDKVLCEDTDGMFSAIILYIDTIKKIVRFIDKEDFKWDEKFEDIPQTVLRKLDN